MSRNSQPRDRGGHDAAKATGLPASFGAPRVRASICAALIVVAVALAWSGSLPAPFQLDDHESILRNESIRRLGTLAWLMPPATAGETASGRPVLNLSFAINYAFGGLDVRRFRATNILIHALAALTLFGIVRRTLQAVPRLTGGGVAPPGAGRIDAASDQPSTGRGIWPRAADVAAFAIALLWAVHPLQTASVTYVVQRAESLAGLFYLLTLYGFIRSVHSERHGSVWAVAGMLACLLGMATKETVATAPVLVLLYDRAFVGGSLRAAWRARWRVHVALAATWLLLAIMVLRGEGRGGSAGFGTVIGVGAYLRTQAEAIVHYVALAIWPAGQIFDYGAAAVDRLAVVWPEILLLAVAAAWSAWALWRNRVSGFLGAGFFLLLAPSSSVVPIATQTIAEHRMYLPLAPLAILGCIVAARWLPQRVSAPSAAVLASLAVLGFATLTFARNGVYRSDLTLWQDTAAKRPGNPRAQNNLGLAFSNAGRVDDAGAAFRRAIALQPNHAFAHANLGIILSRQRRWNEAETHLRAALAADPRFTSARLDLAQVLAQLGRHNEAIVEFEVALRETPDSIEARFALGNLFAKQRRLEPAIREYREVLRRNPAHLEARNNLANCLLAAGEFDEASAHYGEILRTRPADPAVRRNLEIARELQRSKAAAGP